MRRIKWLLPFLICLAISAGTDAQSIKEMLIQVAALRVFISTAEQGYQIAEDGLHTIRDIKNAEAMLHQAHFASLTRVNPVVRNMPQVNEIIDIQTTIIRRAGNKKAFARLVSGATEDIELLTILLNDGDLQMDDGERIRFIDWIDRRMKERLKLIL